MCSARMERTGKRVLASWSCRLFGLGRPRPSDRYGSTDLRTCDRHEELRAPEAASSERENPNILALLIRHDRAVFRQPRHGFCDRSLSELSGGFGPSFEPKMKRGSVERGPGTDATPALVRASPRAKRPHQPLIARGEPLSSAGRSVEPPDPSSVDGGAAARHQSGTNRGYFVCDKPGSSLINCTDK